MQMDSCCSKPFAAVLVYSLGSDTVWFFSLRNPQMSGLWCLLLVPTNQLLSELLFFLSPCKRCRSKNTQGCQGLENLLLALSFRSCWDCLLSDYRLQFLEMFFGEELSAVHRVMSVFLLSDSLSPCSSFGPLVPWSHSSWNCQFSFSVKLC